MDTPPPPVPPASTMPSTTTAASQRFRPGTAFTRRAGGFVTVLKGSGEDLYRAILWTVVAVIAILGWFAASPTSSSQNWSSDISSAESTKDINDGMTEGAPQQQVVNGWFVADTIPVLSEQLTSVHTTLTTGRIPTLLFIFGLGACADLVGRSLIRSSRKLVDARAGS